MHFIERQWRAKRIGVCAILHPGFVMPGIIVEIPDARSCLRANFRGEAVGIRLIHLVIAIARFDVIFVAGALTDIRNEALPDACGGRAHDRGIWVPVVEVAND